MFEKKRLHLSVLLLGLLCSSSALAQKAAAPSQTAARAVQLPPASFGCATPPPQTIFSAPSSLRGPGLHPSLSLKEAIDRSALADYIPQPNDLTTIVHVTFHILQSDDGSEGFQDNAADRAALINLLNVINQTYRQMSPPSDILPWFNSSIYPSYVSNTKVQFSLGPVGKERIHFYQNSSLFAGNYTDSLEDDLINYVKAQNRWAVNELPVFFTNKVYPGAAGKVFNFPSENPSNYDRQHGVLTFGLHQGYVPGSNWIFFNNLHHEFAHILNLYHLYQWPVYPYGHLSSPLYLADLYGYNANGTGRGITTYPSSFSVDVFANNHDHYTNNVMSGTQFGFSPWMSRLQAGVAHRALRHSSLRKYAIRRLARRDYAGQATQARQQETAFELYRAWNVPTVDGQWGLHRLYWNNYHWAIEFVPLPSEIIIDSLTGSYDADQVFAVTTDHRLLYIHHQGHSGQETTVNYVPGIPAGTSIRPDSLVLANYGTRLYGLTSSNQLFQVDFSSGNYLFSLSAPPSGGIVPGSLVRAYADGVYGVLSSYSNPGPNTQGEVFHYSSSNSMQIIPGSNGAEPGTLVSTAGSMLGHSDIFYEVELSPGYEQVYRRWWNGSSWQSDSLIKNCPMGYSYSRLRPHSLSRHYAASALGISYNQRLVHLSQSGSYWEQFYDVFNSLEEAVSGGSARVFALRTSGQLVHADVSPGVFFDGNFTTIPSWGPNIEAGSLTRSIYGADDVAGLTSDGQSFVTYTNSSGDKAFAPLHEEIEYLE